MLITALASAAAIATAQPTAVTPRAGAAAQARASVRILSGERIRFEDQEHSKERPRRWRDTVFRVDGKPADARFIEFE